ncbi:STOMATAL DENSITY AND DISTRIBUTION 1 [Hibiscus trionum]|uniref:STOMATAL DENSITY AND DISTRIBUTION 1 n=1 Tax=Hibiscus trionum TaxID=183268 RepID=A0A9W7MGA3_HIBTR|nr:STOMATAL DENSITY AND DISTRIBUTION 1 [Hibiscus trionum]
MFHEFHILTRTSNMFRNPLQIPPAGCFHCNIPQHIPLYFSMEPKIPLLFSALCFCLVSVSGDTLQTYIVHLHPQGLTTSLFPTKLHWHLSFLQQTLSSQEDPSSRLLYSYGSAIQGFAAQLSQTELQLLRSLPHVVAVRPDRLHHLHTTYSYKFLGLSSTTNGAWVKSGFGRGTVIGVLDTGVWPESPSFADQGMPPPPKKWRGICQEGQNFKATSCNRKLIGARFFIKGHHVSSASPSANMVDEYISPRDSSGHGTHTSSTAGGVSVPMASVLGNGAGVARGMAPGAHIAVYKVCWFNGCYSSDILAAMDVAIMDGVDVLSLSIGGFPLPLFDDSIAIGSFRAVEHGISVICAAGNSGPLQSSVANIAPWIATIGAGTLDRKFPAIVRMGNKEYVYGESLFPGKWLPNAEKELELVYVTGGNSGSEFCFRGTLPKAKVQGKIVVCDRGVNGRAEKGVAVKEAGGAAMILANTEINLEEDSVDAHVLPATEIGYAEAVRLKTYMNTTRHPRARIIFGGTVIGRARAPEVAQFSARGPNLYDASILKPDVIAPGVNIIAAWPQNLGPTGLPEDTRRVNFTVMSGTSMACPHASGIAALIHSAHPGWTPAAIKSAIMTSADANDHRGKPIMDGNKPAAVFAVGAGHVNPNRAIDPGLIYDIRPDEYVIHLCTLGYTRSEIFTITHRNVSCSGLLKMNRGFSLNYPSISVVFKQGTKSKIITRRLTNVGNPYSVYSVKVKSPEGVKVRVKPRRLIFKHINQSLSYRIWVTSTKKTRTKKISFAEGELTWMNAHNNFHRVRSPISVTWK